MLFVYKNHKNYPFKSFQIRWKEPLGLSECPYLYRWTILLFGISIRLHHWIKSDDKRFYHDHSADLISIVLKGKYKNVNPKIPGFPPDNNKVEHEVEGLFNSWRNFLHFENSIWFSKATTQHYLDIPKEGAWTLLLEGKKYHKWGFYVNNHKWRPLRYFSKFGIIQIKDYQ